MDRLSPSSLWQRAAAAQATAAAVGFVRRAIPAVESLEAVFDRVVTDPTLVTTTRSLFVDGYYALAVEEAFKCVNNMVKRKAGSGDDGANLMRTVFSANKPILHFNAFRTPSEKNQQQGYMDIFAGCMVGIRNPRAHEHSYMDEPHVAIEMLAWANHLVRMVSKAKRARSRTKKAGTP